MEKSPFDEGKPRSHKAEVLRRERIVMKKLSNLLALKDEESFRKKLEEVFGVKPGSQQFEDALKAWRLASSSR